LSNDTAQDLIVMKGADFGQDVFWLNLKGASRASFEKQIWGPGSKI